MKRIRLRFVFWLVGLVALFLLANIELRAFPHILLIFWGLLPLLSLGFSLWASRGLALQQTITPPSLIHGEAGMHEWQLENRSRFMAFYVFLPQLMPNAKKFTPVMVQPQEQRTLQLPFTLDHIGHFTLQTGDPSVLYYEDLLGFFLLQKRMPSISILTCDALPERAYLKELPTFVDALSEEGLSVDRPTLLPHQEEIYSVDPMREGESLAHAHWKLSARLQKWMIKHYSDMQQEPQRIIIDPISVSDVASFPTSTGSAANAELDQALVLRTAFLDMAFSTICHLVESGVPVNVANRKSEFLNLDEASDEPRFAHWIATLPFTTSGLDWHIYHVKGQRQIIWIQRIDEEGLGSLMEALERGVHFIVMSEKQNHEAGMVERLERSGIPCYWLDEEEA